MIYCGPRNIFIIVVGETYCEGVVVGGVRTPTTRHHTSLVSWKICPISAQLLLPQPLPLLLLLLRMLRLLLLIHSSSTERPYDVCEMYVRCACNPNFNNNILEKYRKIKFAAKTSDSLPPRRQVLLLHPLEKRSKYARVSLPLSSSPPTVVVTHRRRIV